jgi:putative DNA primase/helicase
MSSIPTAADDPRDSSAPPADDNATRRFLELLFGELTTGFVEFRYSEPGRKRKVAGIPAYLPLPLEYERVASELLPHHGTHTIAVGLAPRWHVPVRSAAGKDHDVLQVGCLWAELKNSRAKGGAVEVLRRVRNFPLRPSVVISSGSGSHVFFALREPLRGSGLLEWEEVMRGLRGALGGEAADELSRVAPLPGTHDDAGVACEVCEEYSSWVRYGLDEVSAAVSATPRPAVTASAGPKVSPDFSADELRRRGVRAELVEAIITGRVPAHSFNGRAGTDDDSGRDFRIASALSAHGFGEDEIKAVFRSHPRGCGSKWARKRNGEAYMESLLAKVSAAGYGLYTDSGDDVPYSNGLPPGYFPGEDGSVWFRPPVSDEARKAPGPVKVCDAPLRISEVREHAETEQVSVVISFEYLGRSRSALMQRARMSDSRHLVATLAGLGAPVTSNNARLVTAYLAAYERAFTADIPRKRVTSRFGRGRDGELFFLPGVSSGVEFEPAGSGEASLYRAFSSRRGSLRGWVEAMRTLADEGLMIPQAAVLASFVPPLQRRLQIPNFILDIHGDTSTGKSTTLRLAASVWGRPYDPDSTVMQWMNTQAAIEQVAGVCGELPVFLDDAQHCPAQLKRSVVYMIANGRGKGRSMGGSGVRETPTWHTVALSTSEEPLSEASPHEGARGRILSVGGQTSPFRTGSANMMRSLEGAVSLNHGHAGETFVRHLNGWGAPDWTRWQQRYTVVRNELLKVSSSDLAGRVSGYIAAVQIAGEVACPLLGLTFQPDMVAAWLTLHLNEQQGEQNLVLQVLRALADYYVTNVTHFSGGQNDAPSNRRAVHGTIRRGEYVGFLRSTIETVFKAYKWRPTPILNKLAGAGALLTTERNRHTRKVSVGNVQHRMVCVKWSSLLPDDKTHEP